MTRYVDASALLPFYRPEPRSEACEVALLGSPGDLVVSDLSEVEVASALARLTRTGELASADTDAILAAFSADVASGALVRVPVPSGAYAWARDRLASRATSLRTLDALHLAVSAILGAELLTADAGLAAAARTLGVPVVEIA